MSYPEIPIKTIRTIPPCICNVNYEDRKKPCKKHSDKKTLIENTINSERGAEKNIPEEQIKLEDCKNIF